MPDPNSFSNGISASQAMTEPANISGEVFGADDEADARREAMDPG